MKAFYFFSLLILISSIGVTPLHAEADDQVQSEVWIVPPQAPTTKNINELFAQADKWADVRSRVDVFVLTDKQLAALTDSELASILPKLAAWGLKLGMQAGAGNSGEAQKMFEVLRPQLERLAKNGGAAYALVIEKPLFIFENLLKQNDPKAVNETTHLLGLLRKAYPKLRLGIAEPYPAMSADHLVSLLEQSQKQLKEKEQMAGLDFFHLDFDWMAPSLLNPKNVKWTQVKSLKNNCSGLGIDFGLRFAAAAYPQLKKLKLADDMAWFVLTMYQGSEYKCTDKYPVPQYIIMGSDEGCGSFLPETEGYTYTRLVRTFCSRFLPEKLSAALPKTPVSQVQTVLMEDDFNYKTSDINGHSPSKGTETWKAQGKEGVVLTDGTQAIITTGGGKPGRGNIQVTYPFEIAPNTLYTLSITFKFTPLNQAQDCWVGFGFQKPDDHGNPDQPWVLIRPQADSGSDSGASVFKGPGAPIGGTRIAASDMSVPVKASITWNSRTGKVQYYINHELQSDLTQKTAPPNGKSVIFFKGFLTGTTVNAKSVTLTAEALNK